MLRKTLLILPLLFLINCGGGSTSTENNDTQSTPETNQTIRGEEPAPVALTSLDKMLKVSQAMGLSVNSIDGIVEVVSGENTTSFNKKLYALIDNTNQLAIISVGSSEIEKLENQEGLVLKSLNSPLPHFSKGYRNILIDANTTNAMIEAELTSLFEDGGVPVMSYVPSSMETNSTIGIKGENNAFVCTHNNNENYEATAKDGLLDLPSDKAGHYLCLDQYNNQAFDYNVSIEVTKEVLGSLYTYNANKTNGASVKIYDDIYSQVDIAGLESRFKESNLLGENDSLKLEVFYKSETSTLEPINTVAGKEYFLKEGTYLLSFLMTSPQNTNINQGGNLSPLKIVPAKLETMLTPN